MPPVVKPINSILIANRGEIACRIIRTAKSIGIRTIAVYSEADAQAPHVQLANEGVLLGAAPAAQSYLNIERILEAAKTTGADAIHPGYGFLSENAAFAQACHDAGIIFIGPSPDAIDLMGDKAKAKIRMLAANVPCVPGYQGEDQSEQTLKKAAKEIGFPIMVKAAAGGGGRGMRLVKNTAGFSDAISVARSEAENAFGSGDLILERAIIKPRHVEIQILADQHGNVIHLAERDCSVQRRHQKVLEEAPCPIMTPSLRGKMGAVAVKAAQDINYVGAGTVEFLLAEDGTFYFLEMNTRLQVEHPVTEIVTGLDLVDLQIQIAQGCPLEITQEDVELTGWAIEARLYAEDVSQDFLPASGQIALWLAPCGDNVRCDAGITTGGVISPHYDPMLAKIIGHGKTREAARASLVSALKRTAHFGVATNKGFLIDALETAAFRDGKATTAFITEAFDDARLQKPALTIEAAITGAILLYLAGRSASCSKSVSMSPALFNWSSASNISSAYKFSQGAEDYVLTITPRRNDIYDVFDGAKTYMITSITKGDNKVKLTIDGATTSAIYNIPSRQAQSATVQLAIAGNDFSLENEYGKYRSLDETSGQGKIIAPMHGMLVETFVKEGDSVVKGDRLAILEAMKMQHELNADIDGAITNKYFDAGIQIDAGAVIMEIEAST